MDEVEIDEKNPTPSARKVLARQYRRSTDCGPACDPRSCSFGTAISVAPLGGMGGMAAEIADEEKHLQVNLRFDRAISMLGSRLPATTHVPPQLQTLVLIKILALCGSLRAASINAALLRAAVRLAPPEMGVRLFAGVADLPLFNPDPDPHCHRRL
jgi:hypothetical protein